MNIQKSRSTHFIMGSDNRNQKMSVYNQNYLVKNPEVQFQFQKLQPLSLKEQEDTNYGTQNKQFFQKFNNHQINKLTDKNLNELKTHHFTLGNFSKKAQSVFKQEHNHKEAQDQANNLENKLRMRQHNHKMEEQDFTNQQSAYQQQFKEEKIQYSNEQQEQIKQSISKIRDSNLVLGSDKSLCQRDIRAMSLQNAKQKQVQDQREKIQLGNRKLEYGTINGDFYQEKPIQIVDNQQQAKELTYNTHFKLGSHDQQLGSSNQLTKKELQKTYAFNNLKNSNVQLHFQQNKNHFQTVTSQDFQVSNNQVQNERNAMNQQSSHVYFGNHNLSKQSEMNQKFLKQSKFAHKQRYQYDTDVIIQSDRNQRLTENQYQFSFQKPIENTNSNKDQQNHHFNLGKDSNNFQTTSKKGFIKHFVEKSQPNSHRSNLQLV